MNSEQSNSQQALAIERKARLLAEAQLQTEKRVVAQALRVLGQYKLDEGKRRQELDERTREVQSAINIFEHQHGQAKRRDLELKLFNSVALFSQEKVTFENSLRIIVQSICELYQLPFSVVYMVEYSVRNKDVQQNSGHYHLRKLFQFSLDETAYPALTRFDHETHVNSEDCIAKKTVEQRTNQTGSFVQQDSVIFDSELFEDGNNDGHSFSAHLFGDNSRVQLVRNLGFQSQFCVPVICNNEVVTVMEFFDDARDSSEVEALKFISTISLQLGNMQERVLAEKEIRKNYKELKRAQRQLVQSEKLASLGQLSAGIAHEINNPVGFVLSNMASLKEYIGVIKTILEEQEAYIAADKDHEIDTKDVIVSRIDEIKTAEDFDFLLQDLDSLMTESTSGMERVKEIVTGLSSFARTEGATASNADINEIIESTLNMVWNELKYKCDLDKQLGQLPVIRCYPSQLGQVFLNLILNASHAIKEKGVIGITTELVGEEIRITVKDTGSGIPPEHLEKLFNPFFTTKPVGEGTGLGLSISYGIIEDHEGRIQVESEVGVGTCFTIFLPVNTEL